MPLVTALLVLAEELQEVAHHQRERLVAGLAAAVAAKGYAAVTLADIVREAKVSRRASGVKARASAAAGIARDPGGRRRPQPARTAGGGDGAG